MEKIRWREQLSNGLINLGNLLIAAIIISNILSTGYAPNSWAAMFILVMSLLLYTLSFIVFPSVYGGAPS